MSDGDDDDDDVYDIHDPRTHEHNAYKISQDNAGRATRRYKYGDDVDDDGNNYNAREEDNHDDMELRLQNARDARGWAFDEANRRYEWNGRWTGGAHDGVEEEADKRMADVERWNGEIEELERHIDHARDANTHNAGDDSYPDSDSDSDSDSGSDSGSDSDGEESAGDRGVDEYEKNVLDAREARERGYDHDDEEEERREGRYDENQDYDDDDANDDECDNYD